MIALSNGHKFEFCAGSGSLAFDGRGWPWEQHLRLLGKVDPHLLTVIIKTLTPDPWEGNLRRYTPWKVIKFIDGKGEVVNPLFAALPLIGLPLPGRICGVVNAVGLTNPGREVWVKTAHPIIIREGYKAIISFTREHGLSCQEMVIKLNGLKNIVGIEYNSSCPNVDPDLLRSPDLIVRNCNEIREVSEYPVGVKLGPSQPYLKIARQLEGVVEYININAPPWEMVFLRESPLSSLGGGAVSGKAAQSVTWEMIERLVQAINIPVIGTSIWEYDDLWRLKQIGAAAFQIGAVRFKGEEADCYIRKWNSRVLVYAAR